MIPIELHSDEAGGLVTDDFSNIRLIVSLAEDRAVDLSKEDFPMASI